MAKQPANEAESPSEPRDDVDPIYYTFGSHMHWVDMEWLWGYHMLPGSARDMIRLCREAGVRGCVNFDGIGYEKLAAEDPITEMGRFGMARPPSLA